MSKDVDFSEKVTLIKKSDLRLALEQDDEGQGSSSTSTLGGVGAGVSKGRPATGNKVCRSYVQMCSF